MQSIDLLLKNGHIFDGTGAEAFMGDIGIAGERIAIITHTSDKNIDPVRVINLDGLSVAPGFIDVHAHSDFALLADPRAEGKISQGITTEINGNCGLSAAPLVGEASNRREEDIRDLGIRDRWSSFGEYFAILQQKKPALNVATLAGQGNIRASVIGYEAREPDRQEMDQMKELLTGSIESGAIGLSTGLVYAPGIFATTEELIDLCSVLKGSLCAGSRHASRRSLYTSHMRSEGDRLIEAVRETICIGMKAQVPVHISHFKTSGKENWHKISEAVDLIRVAQDQGVQVTCDRYPYTASSTDLDAILPDWTQEGGAEALIGRLKIPDVRKKIKDEMGAKHPETDYWENIYIASVHSPKNRWMEGKNIADIARMQGESPLETTLEILAAEKLKVSGIFNCMSEDNLRKILALPYSVVGTDSSARCSDGPTYRGKPHPRGYGSFSRFLGKYVRDESLMSVSEAIRKITMVPARIFHISQRGILKEGAYADLVVFNADTIIDGATYEEPFRKSEGIILVIVNGRVVCQEGRLTKERPGKILKH